MIASFPSGAQRVFADTFANRPVVGKKGRAFIPTDAVLQFIDDGTQWRPLVPPGVLGYSPPTIAGGTWIARNMIAVGTQGAAPTATDAGGTVYLAAPAGGGQIQGIEQAFVNAGTFTFTAAIAPGLALGTFPTCGIYVTDNSGKYTSFSVTYNNAFGGRSIDNDHWTSLSAATSPGQWYAQILPSIPWLRITDDGVNLNYYYSGDAMNWTFVRSELRTGFLPAAATRAGFFVQSATGVIANATLLSWKVTSP